MINCGIDIIEIERIKKAVEKNPGFTEKVFSQPEIEYFRKSGERMETLAGFYAAKEAFVKYKKIGIRGLELSEISIEHEGLGVPFVVFHGERQKVSLSISHNKTSAVAVVCGDDGCGLMQNAEMKQLIPKRSQDANKGNCGRVFIIAGSRGMTGAAYLAAKGALRSGAGLVTVGTAESERHIIACMVPEATTASLEDKDGKITEGSMKTILEYANNADAVVFGPGLGKSADIHSILKTLLSAYKGKLAKGDYVVFENTWAEGLTLSAVWSKSTNPLVLPGLLRYATEQLTKKYPRETSLVVQTVNDASAAMVRAIIPEAKEISCTYQFMTTA